VTELETKKRAAQRRSPGVSSTRDIEKAARSCVVAAGRDLDCQVHETERRERVAHLLPAQEGQRRGRAGPGAIELDKTIIRAGVDAREQFTLRPATSHPGIMRSAGLLIPEGAGAAKPASRASARSRRKIMKAGMIAEVTCVSKPFTVIPWVVTDVQDYIAAANSGRRAKLIDPQQVTRPGTLLAFLEPLLQAGSTT